MISSKALSSNPPSHARSSRYLPWLIFLGALTFRLIFLIEYSRSPFFDTPILDSKNYLEIAVAMANGEPRGELHSIRSPFYPIFLYYLIRLPHEVNYYFIRLVQVAIGSVSCVLLYFIALRLFPRRVSVLAAILMAAYEPFIFFDNQILAECLAVFFNLSSILFLLKSRDACVQRRSFILFSGALLGLSAVTRPNILIFVVPALFFLKTTPLPVRQWIKSSCLYIAGVAVPILPITLDNYFHTHDFILISSSMGINFYIGNNPLATGIGNDSGEIRNNSMKMFQDAQRAAERDSGRSLSEKEVSRYWTGRTFRYIQEDPIHFVKNLIKKFCLFWGAYEPADNCDNDFFKTLNPYLRWNPFIWGNLLPFAIIGVWFFRKDPRPLFLPLSFIAVYLFSTMLLFLTDRYRLPAVPFLLVLSSAGILGLKDLFVENRRSFFAHCICVAALLWVVRIQGPSHTFASSYFNLGIIHDHHNRRGLADEAFRKAIEENPRYIVLYREFLEEKKSLASLPPRH
ncbi:MAG: glycosyltransferase family 39 protein [Nitrospinae bacterium]|nr:glycosyltransferase family 39 protein [Nitrospinota bacterium]